jgi:hypothetical protein
MNKISKITFNLAIFLVIIGFAWYIVSSINKDESPGSGIFQGVAEPLASHFKQVTSFKLPEEINRFELHDNRLFFSAGQSVYIIDIDGKQLAKFPAGQNVRDITVSGDEIYLLYPTRIAVYSLNGQPVRQWEACSDLSDYCSFTIAGDAVFVTDAANKDICKYTTEGNFVKFIKSPAGFIIPSYSFDIDSWNDTIYCVNSGRHLIEAYTLDGRFIVCFGKSGSEAGFFAGCCNPAYISFTLGGTLITSEKGNPRISCFERNGKFNGLLLNSKMLGSGNKACEVKTIGDKLFVAVKNKISVFQCNKTSVSGAACSGCTGCPYRN